MKTLYNSHISLPDDNKTPEIPDNYDVRLHKIPWIVQEHECIPGLTVVSSKYFQYAIKSMRLIFILYRLCDIY